MTDQFISINLLEFVVEIINYAAITVLFRENLTLCKHLFPFILNWTDSKTAKFGLRKQQKEQIKGKLPPFKIAINTRLSQAFHKYKQKLPDRA